MRFVCLSWLPRQPRSVVWTTELSQRPSAIFMTFLLHRSNLFAHPVDFEQHIKMVAIITNAPNLFVYFVFSFISTSSAVPCVDWSPPSGLNGAWLAAMPNATLSQCYEFCVDHYECKVAVWSHEKLLCNLVYMGAFSDNEMHDIDDDVAVIYLHCPESLSTRSACQDSGLSVDAPVLKTISGVLSSEMCRDMCVDSDKCEVAVYDNGNGDCNMLTETSVLLHVDGDKDTLYKHCHCEPVTKYLESIGEGEEMQSHLDVECNDASLEEGSVCVLNCKNGLIPLGKRRLTCMYTDEKRNNSGMEWNFDKEMARCVEPVAMLIGGVDDKEHYSNEVQVVHPKGVNCDKDLVMSKMLTNLPEKLAGASSGLVHNTVLVCGGAQEKHVDCRRTKQGGQLCKRNSDRIKLNNSSSLITGPKSKTCSALDTNNNEWIRVAQLNEARAFAGATVFIDENFGEKMIIAGGVGNKGMLSSVEIVYFDENLNQWSVDQAPPLPMAVFGQCVVSLGNVVFSIGGLSASGSVSSSFSLTEDKWTMDELNVARVNPACLANEEQILVMGGWNEQQKVVYTKEIRESLSSSWKQIISSNTTNVSWARRSATAAVLDAELFVFGGAACDDNECWRSSDIVGIKSTNITSDAMITTINGLIEPRSSSSLVLVPKSFICEA